METSYRIALDDKIYEVQNTVEEARERFQELVKKNPDKDIKLYEQRLIEHYAPQVSQEITEMIDLDPLYTKLEIMMINLTGVITNVLMRKEFYKILTQGFNDINKEEFHKTVKNVVMEELDKLKIF